MCVTSDAAPHIRIAPGLYFPGFANLTRFSVRIWGYFRVELLSLIRAKKYLPSCRPLLPYRYHTGAPCDFSAA